MAVVDFHTHAFPDSLAPRALAALEVGGDGQWRAFLDGTVGGLLASMDAAAVDRAVVCPIATRPEQFDGILEWCRSIRSERIIPLASVHPAATDAVGQVRRAAEAGLPGLKLHPMFQDFVADDFDRMDRLYRAAAEAGLFIVLHSGCDIGFPGSDNAAPSRIAAVAARHPAMTIVAAHMGGWLSWEAVRAHLLGRFENVWMETSFAAGFMEADALAELIRAQGVDKVLFGTDSPWADQGEELARIRALPLEAAELTAILGGNAARLLGR